MNFQVIVEPEDGVFVTYVPALDFASTFGPTREEALARTQELIRGYLEAAKNNGIALDFSADKAELVELTL